jgi:hypothetical protein
MQIATKTPWLLDKSCPRATRTIAQVIMHWIDKLCSLAAVDSVEEADKMLYRQLARLVKDSPGFTTDIDTGYHQSTVCRIRPVVSEIMEMILA